MSNVWYNPKPFSDSYTTFRATYLFAQEIKGLTDEQVLKKLYSKSLVGEYTYTFYVNKDEVNVDPTYNTPEAWQKAFEDGSPDAAGFFSYMRCYETSYDPSTGAVTVKFKINYDGKDEVSLRVVDQGFSVDSKFGSYRPQEIHAYSPKGMLYIDASHFVKDSIAIPSDDKEQTSFKGVIDLSPWMAYGFPLRFNSAVNHAGLTLDTPDASVAFNVENGTWADGSSDPIVIDGMSTEVIEKDGKYVAAATLPADKIPTGMLAAAGYDQATGRWIITPDTSADGIVITPDASGNYTVTYTYTFDKTPVDHKKDLNTPTTASAGDAAPGEAYETEADKTFPIKADVDVSELKNELDTLAAEHGINGADRFPFLFNNMFLTTSFNLPEGMNWDEKSVPEITGSDAFKVAEVRKVGNQIQVHLELADPDSIKTLQQLNDVLTAAENKLSVSLPGFSTSAKAGTELAVPVETNGTVAFRTTNPDGDRVNVEYTLKGTSDGAAKIKVKGETKPEEPSKPEEPAKPEEPSKPETPQKPTDANKPATSKPTVSKPSASQTVTTPASKPVSKTPTATSTGAYIFGGLMGISAIGAAVAEMFRRRKNK